MINHLQVHLSHAVHKIAFDHVLVAIPAGALHCLFQAMLFFASVPTNKGC
jgi:predicted NAD/FAD-dependent oxidoreductase